MEESLKTFDVHDAVKRLGARHPALLTCVAFDSLVRVCREGQGVEEAQLVSVLEYLLVDPKFTVAVVGCFRPIVPRIVDGLIQSVDHGGREGGAELAQNASTSSQNGLTWSLSRHEYAVMALSRTLELAPHVLSAVLQYFQLSPPPFERLLRGGAPGSPVSGGCLEAREAPHLLDVLRASYRLLLLEPCTFRDRWDWSSFLELLQWDGGDSQVRADVRWCATQVVSIVLRMSDISRQQLRVQIAELDEETAVACLLRWEEYCQDVAVEKAGMYMERKLLQDAHKVSLPDEPTKVALTAKFRDGNFSKVEICGIELPRRQCSVVGIEPHNGLFVMTSTARSSLEAVVLALSQKLPILLEGPVGAGKSSLIQEVARLTGNLDILFIHLDDQMDSKTLLGSYMCTETPGEFQWQPGALTQAVTRGLWVVFENIDRAPSEILSSLTPLLEDGKLYIAGRGEVIQAVENFRLFSTVTSLDLAQRSSWGGGNMLSSLWRRVVLDSPKDEELAVILEGRFLRLGPLVTRLIGTLNAMKELQSADKFTGRLIHFGHPFSTRDLTKWCYRLSSFVSDTPASLNLLSSFRERVYVEAVDVFASAIPNASDRKLVLHTLAAQWGISPEQVEFYSRLNKPKQQVLPQAFTVGRATLPALPKQRKATTGRVFANTGHAMRMLESIAACVQHGEPVLLVGETGTGKTTLVQHLARQISMPMVVLNMSQQSDSTDFLGGFKPVDAQRICAPLFEMFNHLFQLTYSAKENSAFLKHVRRNAERKQWEDLLEAFRRTAEKVLPGSLPAGRVDGAQHSAKRKRPVSDKLVNEWGAFAVKVQKAEKQVLAAKAGFAFDFVEGALVKALKEGQWLLLDEINLAAAETLERLTGVLEQETGTLTLPERGDVDIIPRHPSFRIFACMNPATDVGKRDLPVALRSRFTEFFVDEMTSKEDLEALVFQYLEGALPSPPVGDVVDFYLKAREEADCRLLDGAGQKPQYSLRSLSRALEYTRAALPIYGFKRALYDGLCTSFLTLLDQKSTVLMANLIGIAVFGRANSSSLGQSLLKVPPQPTPGHVLFEQFWVERGDTKPSEVLQDLQGRYVLTRTIREHLKNLARAVFVRKYPVLLQGPTSSGKTSLVEYLATVTGHRFVRINNHEHTDLQEYLGTYVTNTAGQLVFQEGILVKAVRQGHWVVLDELNLAPSDVLEALNRLLDDNRELFVPEIQATIKAHPQFMLFATQNPPGIYSGRKILSRAFRNRFLELHVDDIPDDELQVILENRCAIPRSYAEKMVNVMKDLQRHRQSSQVFAGKHGFITARDLFRWAERHANGYEELGTNGYMLLAERLRDESEKAVVQGALEKHMRVRIDVEHLHELTSSDAFKELQLHLEAPESESRLGKIVWTNSMKRLFNLVERGIHHGEPILLVGETGCGKTTVCQMMALLTRPIRKGPQRLHILNCHQHTETSDFLGGFRPSRDKDALAVKFAAVVAEVRALATVREICNAEVQSSIQSSARVLDILNAVLEELKQEPTSQRVAHIGHAQLRAEILFLENARETMLSLQRDWQQLFVWRDGPLVEAMREGDLFLIDEISLAEDSVLERLNSVLEPKRLLVLAEKGGSSVEELVAHPDFRIMATMNPGGDFGKKELSPALRNRFTEIWVPPIVDLDDLRSILLERLSSPKLLSLVEPLLQFWQWFQHHYGSGRLLSVRDLLSWITFINNAVENIGSSAAFVHGAFLVLLDGIGVGLGMSSSAASKMRDECLEHLQRLLPGNGTGPATVYVDPSVLKGLPFGEAQGLPASDKMFGLAPFFIPRGARGDDDKTFKLDAPTTNQNAFRILRAMQLQRPVLLEGSPGVGKTSLVTALASYSGHPLVRINLSEQTDMMDLLGSDLPVEGGTGGEFRWSDGVFLQALKAGDWVLLDELNLASQSVLEGLNACLDHRAEVYVPELNERFKCPATFRVFACQNPTQQGGGRKGLPKSFLNRFTKVYVDALSEDDYVFIASALHPSIPKLLLRKMILFNAKLYEDIMIKRLYGQAGSPWEFNLRDILRWCELIEGGSSMLYNPEGSAKYFLDVLYLQRMRSLKDRSQVHNLFQEIFGTAADLNLHPNVIVSQEHVHVGLASSRRQPGPQPDLVTSKRLSLLSGFGNQLESLLHCVQQGWMGILVGPQASGKTSLVRLVAQLTGNKLHEYTLTTATDTTDLLGSYEQHDLFRHWQDIVKRAENLILVLARSFLTESDIKLPSARRAMLVKGVLGSWATFRQVTPRDVLTTFADGGNARQGISGQSVDMLVQTIEQLVSFVATCKASKWEPEVDPSLVLSELKALVTSLGGKRSTGQFEWVDGGLLKALRSGDWVVLENANLCNPTVLDRLNPLLEPSGTILINERGLVRGEPLVVRAHPNFRLFLTLDPTHGEVSRAMRNRGIEIFMMQSAGQHTDGNLSADQDDRQLVAAAGVPGSSLTEGMALAHLRFKALMETSHNITRVSRRELSQWVSLFQELLQRGVSVSRALFCSWDQTYVQRLKTLSGKSAAVDIHLSVLTDVVAKDTTKWNSMSLYLPGGWPNPLTLDKYVMDAKVSVVRRDSMLVEFLATQFLSWKLALEWQVVGKVANFSEWIKDKMHILPALPGYMLWCHLSPLAGELEQSMEVPVPSASTVEVEQMLKHAALWMFRQANFSDVKLRIQWLKRISRNLGKYNHVLESIVCALEQELEHPLYKELFNAWQKLSSNYHFQELPFILGHVNGDIRADSVNVAASLGSKLIALRRSLLQWQLEEEAYKNAQSPGPGRYRAAWSTISAGQHSLYPRDQTRVHVLETALNWKYRLLASVRKLEDNLLKSCTAEGWDRCSTNFANFQEWHEALWKTLLQPELDIDAYLLCWSFFKRSLKQLCDAPVVSADRKCVTELRNIVETIDDELSLGKGYSSHALLWKNGGHPWLPTSRELLELESKILSFVEERDEPVVLDKSSKSLFVEGLSIVKWLGIRNMSKKPNSAIVPENLRWSTGTCVSESRDIYEILASRVEPLCINTLKRDDVPFSVSSCSGKGACECVPPHLSDITVLQQWSSAGHLLSTALPLLNHISLCLDADALTKATALVIYPREQIGDIVIQQGISATFLKMVVDFSLAFSSRSLTDFVPHQHLLWLREGVTPKNSELPAVLQNVVHELWFNWHRSLWKRESMEIVSTGTNIWESTAGPPRLFLASQTACLGSGWLQTGAVKDYRGKIYQLRLVFQSLQTYSEQDSPPVWTSILKSVGLLLQQIILAHKKSFRTEDSNTISSLLSTILEFQMQGEEQTLSLQKLGTLLRCAQHANLASLVDSLLLPCLQLLENCHRIGHTADGLMQLGKVWINIGALRLYLLLPADGCDPVAKYAFKHDHIKDKHHDLELQLQVKQESELLVRGGTPAGELSLGTAALRVLEDELRALSSKIIPRPSPPTFRRLYLDVQKYKDMPANHKKLQQLLCSLENGVGRLNGDIANELKTWQETAAQFIQRLSEDYPLYRDFVQPVQLAVYELKFGFSLSMAGRLQMKTFEEIGSDSSVVFSKLLVRLMQFPTRVDQIPISSSSASLSDCLGHRPGSLNVQELLVEDVQKIVSKCGDIWKDSSCLKQGTCLKLHMDVLRVALLRLSQEIHVSGLLTRGALGIVGMILESFVSLWERNQELREQNVASTDFVRFTKRVHTMESEDRLDEESFQATFPSYSGDFGEYEDMDFIDADEDDKRALGAEKIEEDNILSLETPEPVLKDIVKLHSDIFGSLGRLQKNVSTQDVKDMFTLAYDSGKQLLEAVEWMVPATLDEQLLSANVLRVGLELQKLQRPVEGEGELYWNFYKDPNQREIALMLDPVSAVVNRLCVLLDDWPEHPILQQLLRLSKSLLSTSLDSPVMKALTGLELLLSKAQQWEETAAKHVSMSGELETLSRLVTRWRKLELRCWPELLDSKKVEHEAQDMKFWFSLYSVLNRDVEGDAASYSREATKSLEDFMQTATIGQFSQRLQLVRAFYGQLSLQTSSSGGGDGRTRHRAERLADILYNIWRYYSQFQWMVALKLGEGKEPIEKELKDLVRLCKWDDRSHYRLAASAEKTHRKLHKLIRRYDEVLKRPVFQLLSEESLQMGTNNLSVSAEAGQQQRRVSTSTYGHDEPSTKYLESKHWNQFALSWINDVTFLSAHVERDIPHQKGLSKWAPKIHDMLGSAVFSESGFTSRREGIWALEDLGDTIISRASELRLGEKKRHVKKKALVDLLKTLGRLGVSRHKSAVPKHVRDPGGWFQQPPSEIGDILLEWKDRCIELEQQTGGQDSLESSTLEGMCKLWQGASDYFFNNMALIQQLHVNAQNPNKDLSLQEVETSTRYVEHILYLQRQERVSAYDYGLQLFKLQSYTSLMNDVCASANAGISLPQQGSTRSWMWQQKTLLDLLLGAIVELKLFFQTAQSATTCPSEVSRDSGFRGVAEALTKALLALESCKKRLDAYLIPGRLMMTSESLERSWPVLITVEMKEAVSANFAILREIAVAMTQVPHQSTYSRIVGWTVLQELLNEGMRLSEEFYSPPVTTSGVPSEEQIKMFDELVVEVKRAVQSLRKTKAAADQRDNLGPQEDSDATGVREAAGIGSAQTLHVYESDLAQQISALRLDRIYQSLANFSSVDVAGDDKVLATFGRLLGCISVPLSMIQTAGMQILSDYILLHRTVTKLGYILGNLFNTLYKEGYCRSPEEEESQEGATKFDEATGTGMGEGEGKKDVSDQIEDEEQLLGSGDKEHDASKKEETDEKEEKGVEMNQDFEGELENLSDDASEDGDDDSEEGDNEQLESKMGQTDDDDQVVDEKLWNDEEDVDTQDEKEKYEKDAPVCGAGKDDLEMRAKETEEEEVPDKDGNREDDPRSNKSEDAGEEKPADTEGEGNENNEGDAYEDPSGMAPSKEEDFPEDMETDGEELGDVGEEAEPDLPKEVELDNQNSDSEQNGQESTGPSEQEGEIEEEQDAHGVGAETEVSTEDVENANGGESAMDSEATAAHPLSALEEQNDVGAQAEPDALNTDPKASGGHQAAGMYSGLQGNPMSVGRDETKGQQMDQDDAAGEKDHEAQAVGKLDSATPQGDRGTTSGKPSKLSEERKVHERLDAQPFRSLGDVFKQWKDRVRIMNEVMESGNLEDTEMEEAHNDEQEQADQYQYVAEGEDSSLQVLGSATEDQVEQQNLKEAGPLEEETDDGPQPMLVDDDEEETEEVRVTDMKQTQDLYPRRGERSEVGQTNRRPDDEEPAADSEALGAEEDLEARRRGESMISVAPSALPSLEQKAVMPCDVPDSQKLNDRELSDARKEVELKLQEGGSSMENARALWQRYDQLTARLSQELAEQLRLILEPTLAAKLEGDYRTGKRINMKKVIPYVASEFKKDKIWLRRTKASKRQYQVVIAIDDSRSMSESHCGHMALEALITTCRAMSQLEIGQMAVASFGEKGNVRLLHDFDHPFSNEAGTNILSQFSFRQDNTIADEPMVDLLRFLTQMLHDAALNAVLPSGRDALQQLVLIIADGRLHEKESLQRCVREGMSRNMLVAFIVLDNPRESILEWQTPSFSNGRVSFSKYMDTFPFPYYTIVRHIEDLPRTIGGLLRQWFELMQRTSS